MIYFRQGAAAVGALFGFLYGSWTTTLAVLLALVVLDYITGVFAAGAAGELKSKTGYIGIGKKVYIFILVGVAHLADKVLQTGGLGQDLGIKSPLFQAVAFFYIANEFISITENGGKLGLPVPSVLTKAIAALKGKGDGQ